MNKNYHTHTYRCGHAVGTERDYIEKAISDGIEVLGFSDHFPFMFPDGHESGFRVKCADAEDYVCTLKRLKEEYRSEIEIHIGFEMEYYPTYFSSMMSYARELGAEYLIQGQHFAFEEEYGDRYCGSLTSDSNMLNRYTELCIEGMETGVFSYLCHPDLINYIGDKELYLRQMRRICVASHRTGVPLEVNFYGIRDNRNYPNTEFWRIAGEENCLVVFGLDSHRVEHAGTSDSALKYAENLVSAYGLTLTDGICINRFDVTGNN